MNNELKRIGRRIGAGTGDLGTQLLIAGDFSRFRGTHPSLFRFVYMQL